MSRPDPATASSPLPGSRAALLAWRELAGVGVLTAVAAVLSAHFDLSEQLMDWLRRRESLQADELPGVLLVLTCGLLWFGWRRYRDVRAALDAHQRAEARLAEQLERNRSLHREVLEVQERERRSVARELHDELGQYLGALRFDLHALGQLDRHVPVQEREAVFARAAQTLGHVQGTVRELIRRLRPVALDELGLGAALDQLVAGWRLRLPEARFTLDCVALDDLSDEQLKIGTFRIVQEALTNVARHSRAGLVEVRVQREQGAAGPELCIAVNDDGVGMDPARPPAVGVGLASMRERARMLGGQLDVRSAPGDGFELRARLPLGPAAWTTDP